MISEVDAGIAHLEKAIALYPKFVAAYILMGAARMERKQWEKAEGALRRAIEIDPKASEALFTLGEAYQRQQKYAEAERAFQDGLKLDPKSPHGHLGLGRVYFARGDLTKAGPEDRSGASTQAGFRGGLFARRQPLPAIAQCDQRTSNVRAVSETRAQRRTCSPDARDG